MAEGFECETMFAGVLGVEESHSCLGFLGRGHDGGDDFAVDKNGAVERGGWIVGFDG